MLAHDRLLEILSYDPGTGFLYWSNGERAGSLHAKGYRRVMIGKKEFLEHRLVWFYVYGVWPPGQIDHRNQNKTDNRIDNLRLSTVSENNMNRKKMRRNQSGRKGVSLRKKTGKWQASINVAGQGFFLGNYDTIEKAADAYNAAALKYHGEFARLDL